MVKAMSTPLSLAVNTADTTSTSMTDSTSDNAENPLLDVSFSGLLQDEFAQLEPSIEGLPLSNESMGESQWQVLTPELEEIGNSLPDGNTTEVSLFMAWQEPIIQSQKVLQDSKYTAQTQPQALQMDTTLEPSLLNERIIMASARIPAQQSNNMENLVKAFFISQVETVVTEPVVSTSDIELPTIQTSTPAAGSVTTNHMRSETLAQPISIPPTRPEWGSAMGERLQWMVNNKIQSAEIRLDPPELGTVDIKIVIQKDSTQIHFITQHAQVKDALEQAMPRLREMFGETGLSLGDVNVSQESFKQHTQNENESGTSMSHPDMQDDVQIDASLSESDLKTGVVRSSGSVLLDTYV